MTEIIWPAETGGCTASVAEQVFTQLNLFQTGHMPSGLGSSALRVPAAWNSLLPTFPMLGPFRSGIGLNAVPLEKIALTILLTIAYHFAPTFRIFYVAEPSFKIREIAINYKDLRFNSFLIY